MEKMKMETPNLTEQNVEKIAELFPNCVTEGKDENGKIKKLINFDTLKQMLSDSVIEGKEVYEFTWPGKKEAIIEANTPIRKTLRPCKEESKNWDTTENLYIEGDNLEVLKLLQESYLGKIKMIYIDPPYNTGNDLIYNDKFQQSTSDYNTKIGAVNAENEERMFKNTDSNGKFHSQWCSMIYPRLVLARNLLTTDGVIFISIDDNEMDNMRKICDEIFGDENFIGQFIWQRRTSPDMRKLVSTAHDYIIAYAKDRNNLSSAINKVRLTEADTKNYKNPDNDPRGPWASSDFTAQGFRPNQMYEITTPGGAHYFPPEGRCWKNVESEFLLQCEQGRMWFGADGNGIPRRKTYLSEREGKNVWTWWPNSEVGHSQEATQELKNLFDGHSYFDYPKPVRLIKKIVQIGSHDDSIILDFFSGSATTAHAVMQLNSEDSGKRKYIMVQLDEKCSDNDEAYKAGFKTICDVGIERIRRSGRTISDKKSKDKTLDIGFRVLKVDSSNMNDVYYAPDDYSQGLLDHFESNIKEDRSSLDLLFGCLLDWGLPLSLPYISEEIDGFTVHNYNDGDLIACFDENISDAVIKEIAKRQPLRAVFRDSSFESNPSKINVTEIFKMLSPDTTIKVI